MDQAENLRKIMQQKSDNEKAAARVIAVTSGKGGVGKSSVSVNLAIQFKRMGKNVVILDADFGLANVEVMFGVIPKYNLSDLLYNGRELKEIICEGPEGIQFISGGSGIANLANFDKEQAEGFHGDNTKVKMIANKVSSNNEGKNLYEKLSMVVSKFLNIDIDFLGVIPHDSYITKAIMKQKPVSIMYPNAASAKHFEMIAEQLMGSEQNVPESRKGIRGYFKNFFAKKNM